MTFENWLNVAGLEFKFLKNELEKTHALYQKSAFYILAFCFPRNSHQFRMYMSLIKSTVESQVPVCHDFSIDLTFIILVPLAY